MTDNLLTGFVAGLGHQNLNIQISAIQAIANFINNADS